MNIKTKRGNLSAYGLGCGYVERTEDGQITVQLSHEHCTYHVKKKVIATDTRWSIWQSYDTLKEAQQAYKNLGGMLK